MKRIIALLIFLTSIMLDMHFSIQLPMATAFPIQINSNNTEELAKSVVEKFLMAFISKIVPRENGRTINYAQILENLNSFQKFISKTQADLVTEPFPNYKPSILNVGPQRNIKFEEQHNLSEFFKAIMRFEPIDVTTEEGSWEEYTESDFPETEETTTPKEPLNSTLETTSEKTILESPSKVESKYLEVEHTPERVIFITERQEERSTTPFVEESSGRDEVLEYSNGSETQSITKKSTSPPASTETQNLVTEHSTTEKMSILLPEKEFKNSQSIPEKMPTSSFTTEKEYPSKSSESKTIETSSTDEMSSTVFETLCSYSLEEQSTSEKVFLASATRPKYINTVTDTLTSEKDIVMTSEKERQQPVTEKPVKAEILTEKLENKQKYEAKELPVRTEIPIFSDGKEVQHALTSNPILQSKKKFENIVTNLFSLREYPITSKLVPLHPTTHPLGKIIIHTKSAVSLTSSSNYNIQSNPAISQLSTMNFTSSTEKYQSVVLEVSKYNNQGIHTGTVDIVSPLTLDEKRYNLETERSHFYDVLIKFFQRQPIAFGVENHSETRNYGLYNLTESETTKIDYPVQIPLNTSEYVDLEGEPGLPIEIPI